MSNSNVIDAEIISETKDTERPTHVDVLSDVGRDIADGLEKLGADRTADKIRNGVELVEMVRDDVKYAKSAFQRAYAKLEEMGLVGVQTRDWNTTTKEKA